MEHDDDAAGLAELSKLVAKYPDLTMTLVADVLQQCDQDCKKAYDVLCEMVIPEDAIRDAGRDASVAVASEVPATKKVTTPEAVRYASANHVDCPPEYGSIFQSSPRESQSVSEITAPERLPSASRGPNLRGVWARKSMGRKYRVDEMCTRYAWIARSVVNDLFDKYGDCVELVEQDILEMFPVDEPEAFGGGLDPTATASGEASRRSPLNARRQSTSPRQRAIAESLRQQAAEEIHRDSLAPEMISTSSKGMARLRSELWEARNTRMRLQLLANQTRNPAHIANAKEKDTELRRLSEFFMNRMRQSEEYKNGCIDLHGLTKDESLQLIKWKLEESGRRFRVITGKGIHSHNGQAVLRPALEKFFRAEGISFSMYEDGIMSIVP